MQLHAIGKTAQVEVNTCIFYSKAAQSDPILKAGKSRHMGGVKWCDSAWFIT